MPTLKGVVGKTIVLLAFLLVCGIQAFVTWLVVPYAWNIRLAFWQHYVIWAAVMILEFVPHFAGADKWPCIICKVWGPVK